MSLLKKVVQTSPTYQAVKLGSKVVKQHSAQQKPNGAADEQSIQTGQSAPKIKKISFKLAKYIGGHSSLGGKRRGNLVLTDVAVGIGTYNPKHAVLQWSDVVSVDTSGGQVGKSKVGATLVFGVLGGLAASGSKNQAAITIHTKDGQAAYYVIDKASPIGVRAKMAVLLRAVGVPFTDEVGQQANMAQTPSGDIAEQLTKLAQLKQQGILTEGEFTAKKKQLLGL